MGVPAHIFIVSGDNGVKMVILERVLALDIVRKIYLSVELYTKGEKTGHMGVKIKCSLLSQRVFLTLTVSYKSYCFLCDNECSASDAAASTQCNFCTS